MKPLPLLKHLPQGSIKSAMSIPIESNGTVQPVLEKVSSRRFRPNQFPAFKYALRTKHPGLGMEMRLGKCLVTIRRCNLYKPLDAALGLKILIICPPSAIGGWEYELTQEHQRFITLEGSRTRRQEVLCSAGARYYIINKEACTTCLPEIAAAWNWDAVILDESHWIKNPKAKFTKFMLRNFRDCPHRWLLTGTLNAEGTDLDLFNQIAYLDGHAFGYRDYYQFRAKLFEPFGHDWSPKPGTTNWIRSRLGARIFIQRQKDVGLAHEKNIIPITVDFPASLRKTYDTTEETFELQDETTIWATTKYNWLRQMATGFIDKELVWDGLTRELCRILQEDLESRPTVVWFHYNHELEYIHGRLSAAGIKTCRILGELSRADREKARLSDWTVACIQQACAREGMDLSRARNAIYFSQTPSATTTNQTEARIQNVGCSAPLNYYYLYTRGTVNEDLFTLLKIKKWRSDLTLSAALREQMKCRITKEPSRLTRG